MSAPVQKRGAQTAAKSTISQFDNGETPRIEAKPAIEGGDRQ